MKNIGIIGFGGMGEYHATQLATLPEFQVVGAYDIKPQRLEIAEKAGIKAYESQAALLADREIDTILIAVPNNFHHDISVAALQSGKNVLCEKPVMMNSAELIDVMEVAEQTGRVFSVHQNRRWDKDFNIIKKIVTDGTIGKPFYYESRVQGAKGIPGDWRCVKQAGGGMMLDWGVHLIDQLMWFIDQPVVEVYAHMLTVQFEGVDDNFKLMLKFKNGISALIEVDTCTFITLPRWHVSGVEGTAQIDDFSCEGKILKANTIQMNWEDSIVYTAAGPTRTMAPRPEQSIDTLPLPEVETDPRDYYKNFAAACFGKEELIVKPSEALRVMRVMEAAFESSEKGICVKGSF